MDVLNIVTFNADGLQDPRKRSRLFQYFLDSDFDVILLQETHVQLQNINTWSSEWNNTSFWNPGPSSKSAGVGILFNVHKHIHVLDHRADTQGRALTIHISYESHTLQISNIYAPDRPHLRDAFFQTLPSYFFPDCPLVLAGDFNMVEDASLDRLGGTLAHTQIQGLTTLRSLKTEYGLRDGWRTNHPTKKQFTWQSRKQNEAVCSRLDRFYMSAAIQAVGFDFLYTVWSDHYFVSCTLVFPQAAVRGPNYWKLNTAVLDDPDYVRTMSDFLRTHIANIPRFPSFFTWWDMTKLAVQFFTKEFCRQHLAEQRRITHHLKAQIQTQANKPRPNIQRINDLHSQLAEHQSKLKRGVLVRSREQVILNEEKPTKFFYEQERQRQQHKHITSLTTHAHGHTNTYTDQPNISRIIHEFYSDLYCSHPVDVTAQDSILASNTCALTSTQVSMLERPITPDELFHTILEVETNKSPGLDGLPIEFYKTFWPVLRDQLVRLANTIFLDHTPLPTSHLNGVIALTHKRDAKDDLSNWRPITLLCADYKLITKVVTKRLRTVLSTLLHPNQTCSVPHREISSNLFLLRDTVDFFNFKQTNTFIVSYDFEKAFDTLDHSFLQKTLQRLNFGPHFRTLFSNMYTNRKAMVMNNGFFTCKFPIQRGLVQGDPLSLPLFCLAAEMQANHMRRTPAITGVHLPGDPTPLKLSQYADDTESFSHTISGVQAATNSLHQFGAATGCRLNDLKTKGLMLLNHQTVSLQDELKRATPSIQWNEPTGLKVLGIHFFLDPLQTQNFNWTKVLTKLESSFDHLKFRHLSLKGKVVLLNSTTLSKVWYLATVLPMPAWALKRLERLIFRFLWGDTGPEPIKRQTLYLPIARGGLGILHPRFQNHALHLKHFFNLVDPLKTDFWIYFARYWLSRRIARHNPSWNFLQVNTCAKYNGTDPPPAYRFLERIFLNNNERLLTLTSHTTKQIYTCLLTHDYTNYSIAAESVWNAAFRPPLPWTKLWSLNFTSYTVGKVPDVLYKIMHNCLPTRVKLKRNNQRRGNYSDQCKFCKKAETTLHLFARCHIATSVWKTFQPLYTLLTPNTPFLYERHVLAAPLVESNITPLTRKLALTLTHHILYELWSSRNKFEKEHTYPNIQRSVTNINTNIKRIITAHYKRAVSTNNTARFREQFSINDALCVIHNGQLVFRLPTFQP